MWCLIPRPWDHHLSWRQTLNHWATQAPQRISLLTQAHVMKSWITLSRGMWPWSSLFCFGSIRTFLVLPWVVASLPMLLKIYKKVTYFFKALHIVSKVGELVERWVSTVGSLLGVQGSIAKEDSISALLFRNTKVGSYQRPPPCAGSWEHCKGNNQDGKFPFQVPKTCSPRWQLVAYYSLECWWKGRVLLVQF